MSTLGGKCALVTGSTAGLGYAIAEELAACGCSIVLNGIVPADEGAVAQTKLAQASGVNVVYEKADLSDLRQIEQLVANAAAHFGGIDVVVNNAVVRHFARIEALAGSSRSPSTSRRRSTSRGWCCR